MIPNPDLKVTSLFNVNISKTIRGRPIVTADHYKVLCGLLNCAIASDLHWLQGHFRYCKTVSYIVCVRSQL